MTANHDTSGLWWTRIVMDATAGDAIVELRGHDTSDYESGTLLSAATPDASPLVVARANSAATDVQSLLVTRGDVAPTLWWVDRYQPEGDPETVSLLAYAEDEIPATTVIDHERFRNLGLSPWSRLGEVRWSPATGQIHLVRVALERRREGIGTALVYAAAAYSRLHDWPQLWGAGQLNTEADARRVRWRGV